MSRQVTKYSYKCIPSGMRMWSLITSIQFCSGDTINWNNQEINNHNVEYVSTLQIKDIKIIKILYADIYGKQYIASISRQQLTNSIQDTDISQDFPNIFKIVIYLDGTIGICYGNRKKTEIILIHHTNELKDRIAIPNEILSKLNINSEYKDYNLSLFLKQHNYRYFIDLIANNNYPNKNLIFEDFCFDESFNRLNNESLLKYHKACTPKKIHYKWIMGKTEYELFFSINNIINSILERFYGAHPDTKTDFIIRIDAENKKYELALYRQGLKEPQIIPEDAYQLLVFKNKFEDYRSDNYNQERGAWIW